MTMRVVIADDEAPARRRLRRLCAAIPGVEVAGTAAGGLEAIDLVDKLAPQVLLLDVQMPELDGFGVAEALASRDVAIVFVTAHDEYAVRAFEVNAVDYVLKPVELHRLRVALDRAVTRYRHERVRPALPAPRRLERLFVEDRGRMVAIELAHVERLLAEANYVRLCTSDREVLHRATLTALASVLDPAQFVRASRSAILRRDAIREVISLGHGDREAVLASGARVRCSRQYDILGRG